MKRLGLLAFVFLFFYPAQRAAAVVPYVIQANGVGGNDSSTSSMTATLANTHTGTGYKIWIIYSTYSTGETLTATETPTCPSGALADNPSYFGSSSFRLRFCYVDPASTHTSFSATVNSPTGGSSPRIWGLLVMEVYGFASGADTAGANNSNNSGSMTVTTNNANEYIEAVGFDFSTNAFVGTGFTQRGYNGGQAGTTASRMIEEYKFAATAGSYTTSFTSVGSFPRILIVAIPFQTAGSNPLPSQRINQFCIGHNLSGGGVQCDVSGLSAGNKLVAAGSSNTGSTIFTAGFTGETPVCPLSSQITHTYGGPITAGLCYADLASNHSTYSPGMNVGSPSFVTDVTVMEMVGLNSGVDAGSEAAAAAQTVNYTTASANEYTIAIASDSTGTTMAPASGFGQTSQDSDPTVSSWQILTMAKTTTSSGSNTVSFTGANTTPLIATFSFGVPSTGGVVHRVTQD